MQGECDSHSMSLGRLTGLYFLENKMDILPKTKQNETHVEIELLFSQQYCFGEYILESQEDNTENLSPLIFFSSLQHYSQ